MHASVLWLTLSVVIAEGFLVQAEAHDLSHGATVRIQSGECGPGWHVGTVQLTKEGGALV